jgi:hypothetical protein
MSQVLVGHVKEAFRLLSKSIIRVETPDINLEEEPEDPEPAGLMIFDLSRLIFMI